MKRRFSHFIPILLIGLVATLSTGCAPMVYDSNPHFSHHRVPPKPMPKPLPKPAPGYGKPGSPAPVKPGNQPTPGRPGTNNHR